MSRKTKAPVAAHEQAWCVELKATDPKAIEIVVFDDIDEPSFFADTVGSKDVLKAVRSAPDAKDIVLRINSRGGVLDQAKGMVNILRERQAAGATITAYVDGIAASAASYLLTVADKVVMPSNTFQMVHAARAVARGTAEDFEAGAALLRRYNDQIAEDYASASARRGKGKTKEDFLGVFTGRDLYLDADEAIEWGLADEKLEELKIAATTVDLGDLEELAPAALKAAPYVASGKPAPAPSPPSKQLILPAIEARETNATKEKDMKEILMALGLPEDADEATAVSAINKFKASARTGADIEKILGSSGDKAVGAVRALKAGETAQTELAEEIAKVKVQLAKRDFDGEIKNGFDKKKLTPALAKMYNERFDAAVAKGLDGSDVVADLQGYIAHAPSIGALSMRRAAPAGGDQSDGPLAFNGKTFAQMAHMERHNLKASDPELYAMMRADWEEAGKPAA